MALFEPGYVAILDSDSPLLQSSLDGLLFFFLALLLSRVKPLRPGSPVVPSPSSWRRTSPLAGKPTQAIVTPREVVGAHRSETWLGKLQTTRLTSLVPRPSQTPLSLCWLDSEDVSCCTPTPSLTPSSREGLGA